MAIRKNIIRRRMELSKGVDNTTPSGNENLIGSMSRGLNADLLDDSIIVKRRGYQKINSAVAWGTRRIRKIFQYFNGDVSQTLLYGEDANPTNSSGELAKTAGTAAPISIKTGLNDNIIPSIVQFGDRAFIFTGAENLQYDGTTARDIGIAPPNSPPTRAGDTTGELEVSSGYVYVYTFYNSDTQAESSPSPASEILETDSNGTGIVINIEAGSSATADKTRIWRSVAGGNLYFLDGETSISATTYDSIVSDLSLGEQVELDNSQLQVKGKHSVVNDNRIFVVTGDNEIRWSKIGQNGPMPESYQILDFVDCNPNDGDKIIGLGVVNNITIVVKNRSVGRLTRIGLNEPVFTEQGSSIYLYEEISREVTSTNHECILTIDNLLVWLGQDNIYVTDGATIKRIGTRILNTLRKEINYSQVSKFHAVVKKDTQQVIFNVCTKAKAEPDFQIVGSYQEQFKFAWTFYSPGENNVTHPGIRSGAMAEIFEAGVRKYYFGCSDDVGYAYQFDFGTNDDGSGIYFDVRLFWDAYDYAARRKMFHSYFIYAYGNGNDHDLTMSLELDDDQTEVASQTKSLSDGSNAVWDTPNWDEFNWSTVKFTRLSFYPHKRGYFGRLGLYNYNADEPVAIKGITAQCTMDSLL